MENQPLKIETEFEVLEGTTRMFIVCARVLTLEDVMICTQHASASVLTLAEDEAVQRALNLVNKIYYDTEDKYAA